MIEIIFSFLTIAAAAESTASSDSSDVEIVVESAKTWIPAKVVSRTAPKYPGSELRRGKEAWVRVAFCIDESGNPQNVSILDSVGGEKFNRAATDTVYQWQYEPALTDGQPSWQSRNQVYITFALTGDNKGASKKFRTQFRKLGKFIDQEQLQEADELFWHIHDTFDLNLYELAKLWEQRVRYEGLSGDYYKLDLALHRATASKGEWIDKQSYIRLLKLRAQVETHIGQYHAAINAFEEISKAAGESSEEVKALKPMIDQLNALIDSDKTLRIAAEVKTSDDCNSCDDSWHFTPVRRNFTLNNVVGSLASIEMRCDHKRFESKVSDLVEWHIPKTWGTCHVNIYGDPGTTFDVLLLPASAG